MATVPARIDRLTESSANPRAVFDRYGLGPPGFWGGSAIPAEDTGPHTMAAGLCHAFEQLGGLYGAFARFLTWRADLLEGAYISRLRKVRLNLPMVPASAVRATVRRELGPEAADLADDLSEFPEWNTLFRTAYLSVYRGVPVIVEVARDPFTDADFEEFQQGMRALGRPELAGLTAPSVLTQFGEWMRNGESIARQRSFLEVLSHYQGDTLADYPRLIPELCTPHLLCWPAVEGQKMRERIARGDSDVVILMAAAILEQFFSLSMVDADLDPDAMVVDADNRLHFLRLHNPIAVLPGLINTGIKYVSAVLAGNAPVAAQHMIRLMISKPPLDLEKQLMDEFSGIEPELKINRWFPASAGAFESNWRALTKLVPVRPMFLDCLNRNLVAVGYWNSDAVRAGAPLVDAISEAQAPVVGRLVRTQFGMLLNRESAQEWTVGTGLLMFGTFREMNRLVEEMRENDISVGVDVSDWRHAEKEEGRVGYQVVLAGLLVVFLASLQWGGVAPEPWSWVLKLLAIGAVPAMFWVISRIG
jgi:hypothetical protein